MEIEERASDPLAGGIMRGYQCGMVWGTVLAAGAQAYQLFGKGPQAETHAMIAAQRIVESFRTQSRSINCREITGIDLLSPQPRMVVRFLIKSAPTGSCLGMAARCAKASFGEINAALFQKSIEVPPAPVSCAAMLAQKMYASDMHTVMAAGLAGGIGLSGEACGALGTAIWITGISDLKEGASEIGFKAPDISDAIERFSKYTNGEFECSKIVGRKFGSPSDHATYLHNGGCSKIIEGLAAK